jgi:hypothetical protein
MGYGTLQRNERVEIDVGQIDQIITPNQLFIQESANLFEMLSPRDQSHLFEGSTFNNDDGPNYDANNNFSQPRDGLLISREVGMMMEGK